REGTLSHDGSPDLYRHLGNSRRHNLPQRDEQGRPLWVIRKERSDSPHKIDLAMAAVLSWEARSDSIAAGALNRQRKKSVYARRQAHVITAAGAQVAGSSAPGGHL